MQDTRLQDFMRDFVLSESQQLEIQKRFLGQIAKGLAKQTHTQAETKCFVTYVQDLPTGKEQGKFLALDLGGTNFRVLLVTLNGQQEAQVQSKIYAISQEIMLGTAEQLFDHIAECLASFVQEFDIAQSQLPLGFTFSFPCVQLGLTQAKLVTWTKGFQCSGVENEDIGRLLTEALQRRGNINIDVMAILNDTTGTLMSCAHLNTDCRIGVIIGTGSNACYLEKAAHAELMEDSLKSKKEHVIINIEWGAFGDAGSLEFVRNDYDRQVDKCSLNVGKQLFEKMISGMYLGELVRLVLLRTIDKQLIFNNYPQHQQQFRQRLANNVDCFETRHISDIEADSFPQCARTREIIYELLSIHKASIEDCHRLRYICECVSQRAATLVAIGLSALINRINEHKVVVGVDGSVYRYHPKFEGYMRQVMSKLIKPQLEFDLMLSEDGSGRGAALVAAVASGNCE